MNSSERSYHHGDLRAALLKEARKMLDSQGDTELSLRALARAAGVSVNAPYRHFEDKNALLAALAAEGFEELAHGFAQAGAGREGLIAKGLVYLDFARRNPGLYRIMFGSPMQEIHMAPALLQASGATFQALRESVAEVKKMPLGAPEVTRDSIAVWSSLHGFVMLMESGCLSWVDGDFVPGPRRLCEVAVAGIEATG